MIYRRAFSEEEWDEIANTDYDDPDTRPHCDPNCFHRLGKCPYCDNYYRQHPDFTPHIYAEAEQPWAGNSAPIQDDAMAAVEVAAWEEFMADVEERLGSVQQASEEFSVALSELAQAAQKIEDQQTVYRTNRIRETFGTNE